MDPRLDILEAVFSAIARYDPEIPEVTDGMWTKLAADAFLRKSMETLGDAVVEEVVTLVCIKTMPHESSATREVSFKVTLHLNNTLIQCLLTQLIGTVLKENQVFYRLLERCEYKLPDSYQKAGGNTFETVLGAWSHKRRQEEINELGYRIFGPLALAVLER